MDTLPCRLCLLYAMALVGKSSAGAEGACGAVVSCPRFAPTPYTPAAFSTVRIFINCTLVKRHRFADANADMILDKGFEARKMALL